MKPFNHALASAKLYGGQLEDYIDIHNFIDSSKMTYAHVKHRAIFHNDFGIEMAVLCFGEYITNSDGGQVSVFDIVAEHIKQDMGGIIPPVSFWASAIREQDWMIKAREKESVFIPFD